MCATKPKLERDTPTLHADGRRKLQIFADSTLLLEIQVYQRGQIDYLPYVSSRQIIVGHSMHSSLIVHAREAPGNNLTKNYLT